MSRSPLFILALVLTTSQAALALLVPFSDVEGVKRLARSQHSTDFFPLATHFQTQTDQLSCGVATGTIVLNALRWNTDKAKPIALAPELRKHLPEKTGEGKPFEARISGYTKDTFLDGAEKVKSKKALYGEPLHGNKDFGLQLDQLARIFSETYALQVTKKVVGTKETADKPLSKEEQKRIVTEIAENLKSPNNYVVVNVQRKAMGQTGGGHLSPLGAYDELSNSFLFMDVNPSRASWVWVPAADLVQAMNTFDTVENRGYLLVSEK